MQLLGVCVCVVFNSNFIDRGLLQNLGVSLKLLWRAGWLQSGFRLAVIPLSSSEVSV